MLIILHLYDVRKNNILLADISYPADALKYFPQNPLYSFTTLIVWAFIVRSKYRPGPY